MPASAPLTTAAEAPGASLLALWGRVAGLPGGRWLFSRLLGRRVPYSGTLGARVEALKPGSVRVSLRDRRAVRNHLRSVHAVALVNLGELASGLAVLTALPPSLRGIVVRLSAEYHAKARGIITARCRFDPEVLPESAAAGAEVEAVAHLTDARGHPVATVTALWRVGARR